MREICYRKVSEIAAVTGDKNFANKCWSIVRPEANVYTIGTAAYRIENALSLVMKGIDEETVLTILERQQDEIFLQFYHDYSE